MKKKSTFSNALYYPVFHCIRKFLYALFIVTIDNGVAVSILCFLLALPGLLYVAIWQPFKSWSLNAGRIVSEAGLFIIFTVLIYSGADVTVKGWGIIFVILLLESILTCVCIFTSLKIEPSERVGDYSTSNVDITD